MSETGKECYGFAVIDFGLGGPIGVGVFDPIEAYVARSCMADISWPSGGWVATRWVVSLCNRKPESKRWNGIVSKSASWAKEWLRLGCPKGV